MIRSFLFSRFEGKRFFHAGYPLLETPKILGAPETFGRRPPFQKLLFLLSNLQKQSLCYFSSMPMAFFNIFKASCVSRNSFRRRASSFASSLSKFPLPLVGTVPSFASYIFLQLERAVLLIPRFFAHLTIPSSGRSFQYLTALFLNSSVYWVAVFIPPSVSMILFCWEFSMSNLY